MTEAGSASSREGDLIDAEVIAPLMLGDRVAVAAGTRLRGVVKEAQPVGDETERALLAISFDALEYETGKSLPLMVRITSVDNARESVDDAGRIVGILPSETWSSRMDQGLEKLRQRHSGLAAILQGAKDAVVQKSQPEIQYQPGVEMTVVFTEPVFLGSNPAFSGDLTVEAIEPAGVLYQMVNQQPFQTMAQEPSEPSDVTNLMFLGKQEQIEDAFAQAGWTTAAELSGRSKLETFRAIVEARGYSEAPVSTLLLEGEEPDLVFQKQLNTFAKRHHLRIWRRPDNFRGYSIWVSAATHDIGIEFSPENKTFIHKIDSNIDRERAKVALDLLHTGTVQGISLVARPEVPKESENATGDKLLTDGGMVVLGLEGLIDARQLENEVSHVLAFVVHRAERLRLRLYVERLLIG
jgi:hypothetical protein